MAEIKCGGSLGEPKVVFSNCKVKDGVASGRMNVGWPCSGCTDCNLLYRWLTKRYPLGTEIIKGNDYTEVGLRNERRQIAEIIFKFTEEAYPENPQVSQKLVEELV